MSASAVLVLYAVVAAVMAAAGLTPMADNVTQRVLEHVNEIPWSGIFFPFEHAEVVEAPGIRPLSILWVKAYIALYGPVASPPAWVYFIKGFLGLFLFGLAGRTWLRAAGYERDATIASISAMLMTPSLFVAWHFTEFDNLTSAAALYATAQLMRDGPLSRWRGVTAGLAVLFALLVKESGALLLFAFLGAGVVVMLVRGRRQQALRHAAMFAMGAVIWLLLAWQLMKGGTQGDHGSLPPIFRLLYIFHNTDQMVYLATPYGALVLFAWGWKKRAALAPLLVAVFTLAFLAAPLHAVYSHYETFYFTPPWIVTVLGLGLVAGLIKRGTPVRGGPPESLVAAYLLMALCAFGVAALLSTAAREDLATRLFLGLAPLLHAAFISGLRDLWARGREQGGRYRWAVTRVGLSLNGVAFAWFVLIGAVNFGVEWNTFHRIEHEAKARMATEAFGESNLLFNHLIMFLGPQELKTHGATDLDDTAFFITGDWLPELQLPEVPWPEVRDLDQEWKEGKKTWVFWFGMRSRMSAHANQQLEMDFGWSHLFPLGILNPFDYLGHNLPEDMRMTTYRPGPTALEWISETRGEAKFRIQLPTWRLPQWLTEVPQRLIRGIPFLESYSYMAKLYELDPPKPKARRSKRKSGAQAPHHTAGGDDPAEERAAPPPAP